MELQLFRFQHWLCQVFGALVLFHDWLQLANLEYVSSTTLEYTVQNLLCQFYTCNLCSEYNVFWHFHTDKSSSVDTAISCFNGHFSGIISVILSAKATTKIHRSEEEVFDINCLCVLCCLWRCLSQEGSCWQSQLVAIHEVCTQPKAGAPQTPPQEPKRKRKSRQGAILASRRGRPWLVNFLSGPW